jgi:hypothetical protein
MNAGRELDAEIAVKVLGLKPKEKRIEGSDQTVVIYSESPFYNSPYINRAHLEWASARPYSTDIAAAWEIVEKLQAEWTVTLTIYRAGVCCELEQGDSNDPEPAKHGRDRQPYRWAEEMAATAPLAICRAALRAVGIQ